MQTNLQEDGSKDYFQMTSGPFSYHTTSYYNPSQCQAPPTPGVTACRQINNSAHIDVDSTLRGIDRVITRYPAQAPSMTPPPPPALSSASLPPPVQRQKELQRGTTDFWTQRTQDFPIYNPQEVQHIVYQEPTRGGVQSRVLAREDYASCQ